MQSSTIIVGAIFVLSTLVGLGLIAWGFLCMIRDRQRF